MDEKQGKKRKSQAPNLFLILLWHHFCYYKRHRILLIVTLLMPFIVVTIPFLIVYAMSGTTTEFIFGNMFMFPQCSHQTISPMSSGPFYYSAMQHDCRLPSKWNNPTTSEYCAQFHYEAGCQPDYCASPTHYAEQALNDHGFWKDKNDKGFCPVVQSTSVDGPHDWKRPSLSHRSLRAQIDEATTPKRTTTRQPGTTRPTQSPTTTSGDFHVCSCSYLSAQHTADGLMTFDMCSWLRGRIVYYPNTDPGIESIMSRVRYQIDQYGATLQAVRNTSNVTFAEEESAWPVFDLKWLANPAGCFENATSRVLGFATRDEMFTFVKYLNDTLEPYYPDEYSDGSPSPILWGAINFDRGNISDGSQSLQYSILRDDRTQPDDLEKKQIYLQDLIESSIVAEKLNRSIESPPIIAAMWKELPSKCWIRPNDNAYMILSILLPIGCIVAFVFAPINFLEQVITEKQLKLREYLSIMGVKDMVLKLSWILFYMIFLIPASILAAVYVHFMYADSMIKSQLTILIVLFVLFNIAQLFLAYFLSSFMKDPKRVSFIYSFACSLSAVFAICCFAFSGNRLNGTILVVVRILSLHCAVPFVLSVAYVAQWEALWMGAKWENFLLPPMLLDEYGGFGEGILWMIGDSILYLILAWYFQNVMPGDYGVRKKAWFFVLPSYWWPSRFGKADFEFESKLDDDQWKPNLESRDATTNDDCVLTMDRLTKFYNREKLGVDRLSMKVYRTEITTLLGQNGAGKSTTMNTLVGLLTPTSGRFNVSGLDGENEMDEIKKLIGFVPQHDILYPSMTVREHLQFFGWLKGMSTKQIHTVVFSLLTQFGMADLKNLVTTKLSGGQKRKLSVLTAFLGSPELVILDEPTTGVDPFSRRSIWDVLLHHRSTTATVLCTHFMDEADFLSDRIAVISQGQLRCVGSPLYLKNQYGGGFRIIVACRSNEAIENAKRFFFSPDHRNIDREESIELTQANGLDLIFSLPKTYARSPKMIHLLEKLEDEKDRLGISSFGISEPTLEEAFFRAADLTENIDHNRQHHDQTNGETSPTSNSNLARSMSVISSDFRYENRRGFRLWFDQFFAVFIKRAVLTIRTPSTFLFQFLLPLTFVIILILVNSNMIQTQSAKLIPLHIYSRYRMNVLFFQNKNESSGIDQLFENAIENGLGPRCPSNNFGQFPCDGPKTSNPPQPPSITLDPLNCDGFDDCKRYCPQTNSHQFQNFKIPSQDLMYRLPSTTNAHDWILSANQTNHWITGGFEFFNFNHAFDREPDVDDDSGRELNSILNTSTPEQYVVIWSRRETKKALLNVFNNLLLQTFYDKNAALESYSEIVHFPSWRDDDSNSNLINVNQLVANYIASFLMIMAFTYATFAIAVSVQQEKISNLKELQYVSGVKPSSYWLANFLWDFLQYMLTLAILMLIMGVVPHGLSNLREYVNILVPYGLGSIGFIYLISFRFASTVGVNRVIIGCAFLAMCAASALTIFEFSNVMSCMPGQSCDNTFAWATYVNYVLRLVPYYQLADGCVLISMMESASAMGLTQPMDYYDMKFLGKRMIESYVMAVVWLGALLLIEHAANGLMRCGGGDKKKKQTNEAGLWRVQQDPSAVANQSTEVIVLGPNGNGQLSMDEDVIREEHRVLHTNATSNDPVVVERVSKTYQKSMLPAVDSVTFSIPRQQCFGLLGVNGAGKTTLFRIMTGFQPPTAGRVLIEGRNVVDEKFKLANNISYCPQENTLFDNLTVREHLRLFAAFRGVPRSHVTTMIESLIVEVGLNEHAHKLSSQLSGGNKRKLNFALALLDYKPVIFLDEPSSGMDPGARRRTWTCIERAVARGCSVILTSHSMDECEAMCHRLVIMARGKLCCIGSVQYLKDKFGNRYTIKIKLVPENGPNQQERRPDEIARLKTYLVENLSPDSRLMEEHGTMIQYEIGGGRETNVRLSQVFAILVECQNRFEFVESFTLSQVTLERVFVGIGQQSQDGQANLAYESSAN